MPPEATRVQEELRELGGLAAARLPDDDGAPVAKLHLSVRTYYESEDPHHRLHDDVSVGGDGQLRLSRRPTSLGRRRGREWSLSPREGGLADEGGGAKTGPLPHEMRPKLDGDD